MSEAQRFLGVLDGRHAFNGPRITQIDLTNNCDNSCIGCWIHSPLLGEDRFLGELKRKYLPFEKVLGLLDNFQRLGVEEVQLAGSGEPFMHPQIMDILAEIKKRGLRCEIVTDLTAPAASNVEELVRLGIDFLTVSVWAGSAPTYTAVHPNKNEAAFAELVDRLRRLAEAKREKKTEAPHVKIYQVICRLNAHEVEAMVNLAKVARADFVEFQAMDLIKEKTDHLRLDREHRESLERQFKALRGRVDYVRTVEYYKAPWNAGKHRKEAEEFGRFLYESREGFQYDPVTDRAVCPAGRSSHPRIDGELPGSDAHPLAFHFRTHPLRGEEHFKFRKEDCNGCPYFQTCYQEPYGPFIPLRVKTLQVLGVGSFLRRVKEEELKSSNHDASIVDSMPCYVGWIYSRVMTDGRVSPCCKGHKKPMGNINDQDFSSIWRGERMNEFREQAKSTSKGDPYFAPIQCRKSCDNVGMNLAMHQRVTQLTRKEVRMLGRLRKAIESVGKASKQRQFKRSLARLWQRLHPGVVTVFLKDFVSGNLNGVEHEFGPGLVIDGGEKHGHAEYEMELLKAGRYELWSRYASDVAKPVEIYVDDKLVKSNSMEPVTGGVYRRNLRWVRETEIELSVGRHTVKISREGTVPHMERLVFRVANGNGKSRSGNGHAPDGAMLLGLRDRGSSYVGIVADSLKRHGVKETARKIVRNASPRRLTKQYEDIIGIYDGEHAYKGPNLVQIDVTNNCTNTCVGCWCHSPLLGEEYRMPVPVKRTSLPFHMVKDLLDQLTAMGTREVYYAGGGEPFMHPNMLDIAAHTKRNGLVCYINTAFYLIDEAKVNRMLDLGIEHLTVSIWAGTPETYIATHPGKTAKDYFRIKRLLTLLNERKREMPYVKVYHVISSRNYHELEPMVDFALETGSESVEFTVTDITPGGTEDLLMNDEQRASVLQQCERIKEKMKRPEYAKNMIIFRFDQFINRVRNEHAKEGEYDRGIIDATPCTIGWTFSRVNADGDVNSCLKSHRFPLGNLYEHSFAEIWNNEKQRFFRRKTLEWNTDDPFFSLIGNDPKVKMGCYKSCDDIGRNLHTHRQMMALTPVERATLQGVAKWRRLKRGARMS